VLFQVINIRTPISFEVDTEETHVSTLVCGLIISLARLELVLAMGLTLVPKMSTEQYNYCEFTKWESYNSETK
jgi:hypothetical protein